MSGELTSFHGDGRDVDAYLAVPAGDGPFPAVIVIHEIWGLDDHIRSVADRFAAEGFVALAPDLYTKAQHEAMRPDLIMPAMTVLRSAPPEVQRDPTRMEAVLGEQPEDVRAAVKTLAGIMNPAQRAAFARDLRGAVALLRADTRVDGSRVASLGFCMGGGISARLATIEPDLWKCVIFYGEHPPLEDVSGIQASVLGLYGGEDARITDTVPEFVDAMAAAGRSFAFHTYSGAGHAFFNDTRPSYNAVAARDAWERVLEFLG